MNISILNSLTILLFIMSIIINLPGGILANEEEEIMKPVGPTEYRAVAMAMAMGGSGGVRRRHLAPFQLCLLCKCCAGATCASMPCCFGINCQLPNKPFGVCAFVPNTCNCNSCSSH